MGLVIVLGLVVGWVNNIKDPFGFYLEITRTKVVIWAMLRGCCGIIPNLSQGFKLSHVNSTRAFLIFFNFLNTRGLKLTNCQT